MMYVKLAIRVLLNLHDLNNEASIGNFTDIRKVKIVGSKNEPKEVIAVSGNMLKHWHFVYVKRLLDGRDNFCQYCEREEAWRLSSQDERLQRNRSGINNRDELFRNVEADLIRSCAIEDIHGFLSPSRDLAIKRESRVRFSWMVPVEDSEEVITTAVHNRVAKVTGDKDEAEKQQMFFYKQYASGIYTFSASLDIGKIGLSDYNFRLIDGLQNEVITNRRRAAIEAFIPMLGGEIGGNISRSLPISRPLSITVAYSSYAGLPNLVSAHFSDYFVTNVTMLDRLAEIANVDISLVSWPQQDTVPTTRRLRLFFEDNPISVLNRVINEIR